MKLANYISMCSLALCLLSACDSDLEKTVYNENAVKPAILQELESSYILESANADKVATTFEWSKPAAGYQAAVNNSLEIALAGTGFKNATVLSSSNDRYKADVTVINLNKAVLELLNNVSPAEAVDVEFRISSSISNGATPFVSNVVKTKILPYSMEKEYPFIAVRGDYSGWNFGNSQKVYSKDENHDYAGMIFFGKDKAKNGWKFCLADNWDLGNWGYSAGASEATEIALTSGGEDIKTYLKTSYYVQFNNETGVLKMTKGHNSWGINKQGAGSDVEFTLSTNTVNSILTHILTATIELKAGDIWKIRPDNNDLDAIVPADVEHSLTVEGDYFKAEEDGTFLVTWTFNKVKPRLTVSKQ